MPTTKKKKTRRKRVHVKGHTRGLLGHIPVKAHDRMIKRKRKKK